jgi:hypothetical protein
MSQVGEQNNRTKLQEFQVRIICSQIQNLLKCSLNSIAKAHNLGYDTVRMIYRGKTWQHISCNYDFSVRRKNNACHTNGQ